LLGRLLPVRRLALIVAFAFLLRRCTNVNILTCFCVIDATLFMVAFRILHVQLSLQISELQDTE
jgi:hypothetical protein